MLPAELQGQRILIGANHDLDQFSEGGLGLPAQDMPGLGGVPDQQIDLRRTIVARINLNIFAPIELRKAKGLRIISY